LAAIVDENAPSKFALVPAEVAESMMSGNWTRGSCWEREEGASVMVDIRVVSESQLVVENRQ
jgi:hypothetical protein